MVDRTFAKLFGFAAALILLAVGYGIVFAPLFARATPATPRAISTVLVQDDNGHGSGVYIGHGLILTAAHVVNGKSEMTVVDSLGHKQQATVLRSDKTTDVALLHIDDAPMATSHLNCAIRTEIGDEVMAIGNPLELHFVRVWGRVSTGVAAHYPWKQSLIVNMVSVPGMSGGGVFDKAGNLIGITVGVATLRQTDFALGYVVPVQAACELLGKA